MKSYHISTDELYPVYYISPAGETLPGDLEPVFLTDGFAARLVAAGEEWVACQIRLEAYYRAARRRPFPPREGPPRPGDRALAALAGWQDSLRATAYPGSPFTP